MGVEPLPGLCCFSASPEFALSLARQLASRLFVLSTPVNLKLAQDKKCNAKLAERTC